MDRRSWLWRRKSLEKSPGETESSGSVSSHSERYYDDQEALRDSPNNASPNHAQSPEDSSNVTGSEVHEPAKGMTEKLSASLMNISVKDDLVKQHMKVAEEAISGWEKAEAELAVLKQQVDASAQKNSSLEDRIGQLDGALKESIRQLRQSREEQEQKVDDALLKKIREWESDKFELENQLIELQVQLEAAKAEVSTEVNQDLQSKFEAAEKENMALKVELLARSEDLRMQTLEKELSTRAAEIASKQHLESINKVAKLEAECCRLRAVARRISSANDHKPIAYSVCVESITDSQSDSGERLLGVDNDPSCSDSWASALIAELDHFKNDKTGVRNLATSIEIDLMDDFLEMERLVAMPEYDCGNSSFELKADPNRVLMEDGSLESELKAVQQQMAELKEKLSTMEIEKAELERALIDTQNRLEVSCNQLTVAEDKFVVLQRHVDCANESRQVVMAEVVSVEEKSKALEFQLESEQLKVGKLLEKVDILEGRVEKEKAVSAELTNKLEALEATSKALECDLISANLQVEKLCRMVDIVERQVKEEKALCAEYASKLDIVETTRKELVYQLQSAQFEIGKLGEKVVLSEGKIDEERSVCAEFLAEVEAAKAAIKALEMQLKSAHLEVESLHDKVALLERTLEEEKALSAQLAVKCQNSENELLKKKQEDEVWTVSISNGALKVKQDKELAVASGKLAECQTTIASLSRQLKSLASLDDFMHEAEKLDLNGGLQDFKNEDLKQLHASYPSDCIDISSLPYGKGIDSPAASSPVRVCEVTISK